MLVDVTLLDPHMSDVPVLFFLGLGYAVFSFVSTTAIASKFGPYESGQPVHVNVVNSFGWVLL